MSNQSNNIHQSAYKGDYDYVKSELDKNPDLIKKLDENERTLLHWACVGGNLKLVTTLRELGAEIDPIECTGMTPLILASSAGHKEIVSFLIAHGAKVNQRSHEGHSALQYAASKGWLEICQELIEHDADVNVRDKRGATPLHRAASKGNIEIVKLLLNQKGRLQTNLQDIYGSTALHLACDENRQDVTKLLVAEGDADLEIKDKEGKTALDLCDMSLRKQLMNCNKS